MTLAEIIEDIKGINRLLDPKGQAWAEETKARREAYENETHALANRTTLEEV